MTELLKDSDVLDLHKTLGEWALSAGRLLQSKQTQLIHHCYQDSEHDFHTIPILENILFVLALFRTRTMENVQEGKGLLAKILAFQVSQGEAKGNFPVYLHEYPVCTDSAIALKLLAPFYLILNQFGTVLGTALRIQMEESASKLIYFTQQASKEISFPFPLSVRFACSLKAFGRLLKNSKWEEEGESLLKQLEKHQLNGWVATTQLGHILLGLQMVYPSLKESPWKDLWLRLESTWFSKTGSYLGPSINEWQDKEEGKPNLYDLFAGYFSNQFSRRASILHPLHLQGVLVQPSADRFETSLPKSIVGVFNEQNWIIQRKSEEAFILLEKKENDQINKAFSPFKFVWGDHQREHSFICQGGEFDVESFECNENTLSFLFHLKSPEENQNQKREVEFFIDFHPDVFFKIDQHPSNTFELGQELSVSLGDQKFSLCFELVEGEGHFLGHVMRGNRPSQVSQKKEHRFHSYDWTLFLRSIRRSDNCKIRTTLTFKNVS